MEGTDANQDQTTKNGGFVESLLETNPEVLGKALEVTKLASDANDGDNILNEPSTGDNDDKHEKSSKPKKTRVLSEAEEELHELCDKGPDNDNTVNKILLIVRSNKVRVDCPKDSNITPLMSACYRGFYNISKALIDAGADVNSNLHDDFYTPLHFAALNGKHEVVSLLLERGAKTSAVNGMGKTAADLAAFVGHRASSSLMANYCSMDVLEYYTKPHGFQKEAKLPMHLLSDMHALVTLRAVHPVKIINTLEQHPQLLVSAPKVLELLRTLITKQMKEQAGDEMSEKLAVKLHVFACVIRYVTVDNKNQRSLTELKKALVVGAEPYGEMETLERFLRSCLPTFEYPESLLVRVCVKALVHSNKKSFTSALCALTQGIFGLMSKDGDEEECSVCGGVQKNAKKCGNCHSVTYCSRECQQLHWFTHKKFCQKLKDKAAQDAAKAEIRRAKMLELEKKRASEQEELKKKAQQLSIENSEPGKETHDQQPAENAPLTDDRTTSAENSGVGSKDQGRQNQEKDEQQSSINSSENASTAQDDITAANESETTPEEFDQQPNQSRPPSEDERSTTQDAAVIHNGSEKDECSKLIENDSLPVVERGSGDALLS